MLKLPQLFAIVLLLLVGGYLLLERGSPISSTGSVAASASDAALAEAFAARRSDLWVEGSGKVVRILPDDERGSRHQRFILELASGQTLHVAHNIDIAPRLPNLAPGAEVAFRGEYEWNARGGALHWTHRDPGERHAGGWLRYKGIAYR